MNSLSIVDKSLTMSSLEISELTGKEHKNVIRDIRAMLDELKKDGSDLSHVREDKDARGYTAMFHLDRELTDTLLTGYSVPMRRKVVARWHELEAKVAKPAALSTMEILQLAMESEKGRLLAIEQRDHAIATKAQISDRKTATAMATASAKARENTKLKALMGAAAEQASILAVQDKTGVKTYQWRKLKAYSIAASLPTGKSFNPGLQLEVNTYSADAWMAVYSVDLAELFGEVLA